MSFDADYEYDVFVSYAHRDNLLPEGSQAKYGWVTTLARNLNTGPGVSKKEFYIDHRLQPGDAFGAALLRAVERSAVLLIVLSQNYVESRWCGDELRHFVASHGDDPDKPRNVVAVELAPFQRLTDVPRAIAVLPRELIQAKFWSQPLDSPSHLVAGYPSPPESTLALMYWDEISRLTNAVDMRLKTLRSSRRAGGGGAGGAAPRPIGNGRTRLQGTPSAGPAGILLAEVTPDLEPTRRRLAEALEAEGILVLPENDYGLRSAEQIEAALRADLAASRLFVQLLSCAYGWVPAGADRPLPQIQFAHAVEAGLPILQWAERLLRNGEADDDGHARLFVTPHLRTVNIERFKDEVVQRYRDLTNRPVPPALGSSAHKAVFLDDALGDSEQVHWIREILRREQCEIRSLPRDASLDDQRFPVRDLMRSCRAGLSVYADRRDRAAAAQRLYWCLNQIAEYSLPYSRWGVHYGPAAGDVDLTNEFGIDSDRVVAIPWLKPQSEQALVSFLLGL